MCIYIAGGFMDGQKRVAIVEDDGETRAKLRGYFSDFAAEHGESFDVSEYGSGEDFLAEQSPCDIILMDIELPGKDGMETVRELRKRDRNVIVIFATNMAQFAVKGYEVEAFDFIVKPIKYGNIKLKLLRAVERLGSSAEQRIKVHSDDGLRILSVDGIKYVEVMNRSIIYHTTDGDVRSYGALKNIESTLPTKRFAKCNSCYLVNLGFVTAVKDNVVTVGGDELTVSRGKRKEFLQALGVYMENV